ncbi:MAG: LysM peptidoglycan-binding domain-containing protein [Myxococcaceae bacterium]|nr:LysM peptidoglycan-binding domain-containing protein [Myxococcaceae bacterium]
MLLLMLAVAAAAPDVPMPPPPPGMERVEPLPPVTPAEGDEAEAPEGPSEVDEMRALEETTLEPAAKSDAALREQLQRLGLGNALRERIEQALDDAEGSGESLPFVLDPVTDVAAFDVSLVKDRYDIPVEMQPLVAQYLHFFQHQGRKWYRRWMGRSTRYIPMMQPVLVEAGLPKDTVYLAMIESGFSTQARSWAAAVGPWQFIAGTADMFHLKRDFWLDERNDFMKSTKAAAAYLSQLYANHGHWYLAWAGYNTGGGRVRWITTRYGTRDFWELSNKKPGFAKETKHYVPKLIAAALIAKHPEAFGFSQDEFEYEKPLEYDEVPLDTQVDLDVLARIANTTLEDLKVLNPELKRWCTPPASEKEPYIVRVPKGQAKATTEGVAKLGPGERLNFKVHRVAKGDTLSGVATKYASAAEAIMRVNGIKSARSLKLGTDLLIPVPSAASLKAGKTDAVIERQVARARRSGLTTRPEDEVPAGTQKTAAAPAGTMTVAQVNGKTRVTYGIGSGDSLWSIAQRFDVSVSDLKNWNEALPKSARALKLGTALTIWPGPKANLGAAK